PTSTSTCRPRFRESVQKRQRTVGGSPGPRNSLWPFALATMIAGRGRFVNRGRDSSLTLRPLLATIRAQVQNRELASFRRTVPLRSGPHICRLNPQVRNNKTPSRRGVAKRRLGTAWTSFRDGFP